MSTALAERPADALTVTADQLALVKNTIAKDATTDELRLYLYDCQRQGVHPLDRLIHFTKRSGKYTPITSIDFMRVRAADTGEYAGSDDTVFHPKPTGADPEKFLPPSAATVTVWRLVQGQRCAFVATARWAEYKPETNDFMWKKMPHTMLAKCAEALALRKGFPRQLAGLYAKEEMDQAEKPSGYVVEAPVRDPLPPISHDPSNSNPNLTERTKPGGLVDTGNAAAARQAMMQNIREDTPGALYIERIQSKPTKNPNVTKYTLVLSDGREVGTIREKLAAFAEQCTQDRTPVVVTTTQGKYGEDLVSLLPADVTPLEEAARLDPLDASDIPF